MTSFYRIVAFLFLSSIMLTAIAEEHSAEALVQSLSLQPNGTFAQAAGNEAWSANGVFRLTYDLPASDMLMQRDGHGGRELRNLRVFENGQLVYSLDEPNAADLYVSNSGILALMEVEIHNANGVGIRFTTKDGKKLHRTSFKRASLFGFSDDGQRFGVNGDGNLHVINPLNKSRTLYPPADQFAIAGEMVAIARGKKLSVFEKKNKLFSTETDFLYPRKIALSANQQSLAIIDKRNLKVYNLNSKQQIFTSSLQGKESFRDLRFVQDQLVTGIHYLDRSEGLSRGSIQLYNESGVKTTAANGAEKRFQTFENETENKQETTTIPWPFVPFDSMHTVWNYYEQHMGLGGSNRYMHQGLDMIIPIAEPTYAVTNGLVKCVLTLGGAAYWRVATSQEQTADFSRGWLYAHLIENSIMVAVGDTVQVHDYIGDIIAWTSDWGHIHFVEIEDSGLVWRYEDNEWGITFNPLEVLRPNEDIIAPVLEDVFPNEKFAFCLNETSTYLSPNNLSGEIDIICKVVDYIGQSTWQQPAYETFYWVRKISDGVLVHPRTLGQRLSHQFEEYNSGHYTLYAPLIYKSDGMLLPSSWNDEQRNYYHLLTNNNGDSLAVLSEENLAFNTAAHVDGDYRIYVEALDQHGNSTTDSMDVTFNNGIVTSVDPGEVVPQTLELLQNYPNPFNPSTTIAFTLPESRRVRIEIFNTLGQSLDVILDGKRNAGFYELNYDASNLKSGTYFYKLTSGDVEQTKKFILLK
ncbi:MAG: T9SS type A sorting domain-containing protein [Calditrichia bacterium]